MQYDVASTHLSPEHVPVVALPPAVRPALCPPRRRRGPRSVGSARLCRRGRLRRLPWTPLSTPFLSCKGSPTWERPAVLSLLWRPLHLRHSPLLLPWRRRFLFVPASSQCRVGATLSPVPGHQIRSSLLHRRCYTPLLQGAMCGALVQLTKRRSSVNVTLPGPGLGFRRDVTPLRTAAGRRRGGPPPLAVQTTRTKASRRRRSTQKALSRIPCSRRTCSDAVVIRTPTTMVTTRTRRKTTRATWFLSAVLMLVSRGEDRQVRAKEEAEIRDQRSEISKKDVMMTGN